MKFCLKCKKQLEEAKILKKKNLWAKKKFSEKKGFL